MFQNTGSLRNPTGQLTSCASLLLEREWNNYHHHYDSVIFLVLQESMVVQVSYKFISPLNIAKLCSLLGVGSFNSCQLSFFDTLSTSAKTSFGFLFQELMY